MALTSELSAYQPEWSARFEAEHSAMRSLIGAFVEDIYHVGSTAIPGILKAKPEIDILIIVNDLNDIDTINSGMRALGYDVRGGHSEGHRYFSKNASPVGPYTDTNRWLLVYGMKGGVLAQHMSHDLDLLWWWLGCPQPEWAFAAKHHVHPFYDGPEGPAEDYFSGLIGFAGHKTIQIDCSNSSHSDSPRICELHGTDGAIAGNTRCGLGRRDSDHGPNEAIFRFTGDGYEHREITAEPDIPHTEAPPGASPFYHEIEHFAMAVAGEVAPEVSAGDAYTFMKILDALYDSARSEEKIIIGKPPPGG